ncbi:hypothetical protein DID74_00275 [Candidatus Marinamargulisbacteria bacterium SCGC AG-333-B06]|nr:hypothetical protein DID74_00275 [Candidatus Marinamargulisbacteria bacterium SCGC AG-333-B06]
MNKFKFREEYLCYKIIKKLKLNLNGLNVLTEAASGYYSWTPILAALAGANVLCFGKDSSYGLYKDNKDKILNISQALNINSKLNIVSKNSSYDKLEKINIVTNSGLLRPIDKNIISKLGKKSIISLMWETWEFRETDLDLMASQKYEIPVVGTNENFCDLKMHEYNGYYMLKLLFDMKIEVYHNHIVIFGHKPAFYCVELFKRMGVKYTWFSPKKEDDSNSFLYSDIQNIFSLDHIDAIIFADHESKHEIMGRKSKVSFTKLKSCFPQIRIGHVCGGIDVDELQETNLYYFPEKIQKVGFMSYQPDEIGAQPVLELFAAGLKVGEIAARARLNGASVEEAIQATVDYGIGQDFDGGFMNFNPKKVGSHHD